jgi:hypothetical protein
MGLAMLDVALLSGRFNDIGLMAADWYSLMKLSIPDIETL